MKTAACLIAILLPNLCISQPTPEPIKQLDFLIGTWNLHEVTYPGQSNEYVETGTRTCAYALNGSYIQCETKAIRKGKERVYLFLINYLKQENRYQLISLYSDFDQQGRQAIVLDSTQSALQITALPSGFKNDFLTRSTLSFTNPDKLVWQGWTSSTTSAKEWVPLYVETATRIR